MDLGTDHCYAGVPLALLRYSHKALDQCLEVIIAWISFLLPLRMPFERRGERIFIQAGDNACQV